MFAPPTLIETEVFARLPESLRQKGRTSDWLDIQQRGAEMDSFLEGPSFDRDGNLYVVDIPYGRVFRITPDGPCNSISSPPFRRLPVKVPITGSNVP